MSASTRPDAAPASGPAAAGSGGAGGSVGRVPVALAERPVPVGDPLDLLLALRALLGEQAVFLLESLAGPQVDTRSSLVGVTGLLEVRVHRGRVTLHPGTGCAGLAERVRAQLVVAGVATDDPAAAVTGEGAGAPAGEAGEQGGAALRLVGDEGLWQLPRALDAIFEVEREADRFGLGVLAFYGYDAVRYIERLPRAIADPPDPAPDAVFALVHALVTVDLETRSASLSVAEAPLWPPLDLDGPDGVLAAAAAAAASAPGGGASEDAVPAPERVVDDVDEATYHARVRTALEHVRVGDVYQVQVGHELTVTSDADPLAVYRRLRRRNPSPYMSLLPVAGRTVVGASPELFVRIDGPEGARTAVMRPIAGTARRGADAAADAAAVAALQADPKERAEHVMLVDLCRNDLGRVAEARSTEVTDLMVVEAYSHVFHLVSSVQCAVRPEHDAYDVIRASFPAGTMTGAPKVRAMEVVEGVETSRRGLYAGSFGLIGFGGWTLLGLAIRMAVHAGRTYALRASAGVVADSTPAGEWRETLVKLGATYWAVTGEELA